MTVSATQLAIPPKKKGLRSAPADPALPALEAVAGGAVEGFAPTEAPGPARSAPVEDVEVMTWPQVNSILYVLVCTPEEIVV